MLVLARPPRQPDTRNRANSSTIPRSCPGREHERRLLVDLGELEHGRRRRLSRLERRDAPPGGWLIQPCSGCASIARHDSSVSGRLAPPSARARAIAQRRRQALVVAEQQEHRRLARPVDLDRAPPGGGALEPALDARVDRPQRRARPAAPRSGRRRPATAASATEPAGPSSSSSPLGGGQRPSAAARARRAIRIQLRPRRSRHSSTSQAQRLRPRAVRAGPALARPRSARAGRRRSGAAASRAPGTSAGSARRADRRGSEPTLDRRAGGRRSDARAASSTRSDAVRRSQS